MGRGAYSLMSKLPPGDLHVKFDLVESDLVLPVAGSYKSGADP